ncbi:hypothetical protein N431DRAFT_468253 [Stipitochalara longipes BDJ]|nr:hypothetical protein N431DRAFT_468253 [Stipitochalara longipes BDJ]
MGKLSLAYDGSLSFESEEKFDVIAVHGLGVTSPRTWIAYEREGQKGTHGREFIWLVDLDMLPSIIPGSRIWTFDYNSNYYQESSAADLVGLGDMLLSAIEKVRRDRGNQNNTVMKSILFIGSCFGGLVVAQALVRAAEIQRRHSWILFSTIGTIFLGTPFGGTKSVGLAQWRTQIGKVMGKEVSNSLLHYLDNDSSARSKLVETFCSIAVATERPGTPFPQY